MSCAHTHTRVHASTHVHTHVCACIPTGTHAHPLTPSSSVNHGSPDSLEKLTRKGTIRECILGEGLAGSWRVSLNVTHSLGSEEFGGHFLTTPPARLRSRLPPRPAQGPITLGALSHPITQVPHRQSPVWHCDWDVAFNPPLPSARRSRSRGGGLCVAREPVAQRGPRRLALLPGRAVFGVVLHLRACAPPQGPAGSRRGTGLGERPSGRGAALHG